MMLHSMNREKVEYFTIFLYFIIVSFQLLLTFNEIRVLLVGYTAFNKLPKLCTKNFPKYCETIIMTYELGRFQCDLVLKF